MLLFFFKCVAKTALISSAAVRMTTFGLVTSVPPMGNVTVTRITHVAALRLFPQMDSIVSQSNIKVSAVVTHTLNPILIPKFMFFEHSL